MREIILEHLLEHGSITDAEAWTLYKCRRLAQYIHLLRKDGYPIETEDVDFIHSVTGRKAQYARYHLEVVQ